MVTPSEVFFLLYTCPQHQLISIFQKKGFSILILAIDHWSNANRALSIALHKIDTLDNDALPPFVHLDATTEWVVIESPRSHRPSLETLHSLATVMQSTFGNRKLCVCPHRSNPLRTSTWAMKHWKLRKDSHQHLVERLWETWVCWPFPYCWPIRKSMKLWLKMQLPRSPPTKGRLV